MRKPILAVLVLMAIGVLMVGSQQAGATHLGTVVLVDGTDGTSDVGGCGNPANPCNTIQTGINHANPGDTVQVEAGTYAEVLNLAKLLTLRGEQAGVDACGRTASETIVTGAAGTRRLELDTGSAGSKIDGFTFSGGTHGIWSDTGPIDGLQILNNRVRAFTVAGVFLDDNGINITADQNEVDGTVKVGGGGLFHLDTDNFDGFHFTNNCVVNGTTGTGFFVDGNRNVDAGTLGSRAPLFHGNFIDNNGTGTNLGSRAWGTGPITENTFSRSGFDGLQGGPRDTTIARNVFASNGRHGLAFTSFGNTTDPARGAQNDDVLTNCFTGNGFAQNGAGIFFSNLQFLGTMSTNEAHNNSIIGNAIGARYPAPGTEVINATLNWWGASNGPGPPDGTGSGDGVDGHGQIIFIPFLLTPATGVPAACPVLPQPPLDHFKCYKVAQPDDDDNGSHPRRRVTLKDQFGSGEAFVDEANALCNPAEKNNEGRPNQPDAHLVSYDIDPIDRRFLKRRVEVENQFGTLTLTLKDPDTLLVPSSKAHPPQQPGNPPTQLDHFQCYPTLDDDDDDGDDDNGNNGFQPRTVTLKDQFFPQGEQVKVVEPVAVCNPVDKNNEGIRSIEEHLTCYSITTRAGFSARNVTVRNQFGTEPLRAVKRKSLCVPSRKRDLGPVPEECVRPPAGLVSWWPGDGNYKDIADGNDAAPTLTGTGFAPGKVRQAFTFDGLTGAVRAPETGANLDGFTELTLDAWIRPGRVSLAGSQQGIVTKYDSNSVDGVSYYLTEADGGKLRLAVFDTVAPLAFASYTSNSPVITASPPGRFTHVAGTWDGGFTQADFHLYVNGDEVPGTLTLLDTPANMADNDTPVNIGRFESSSGSVVTPFGHFQGEIDEVEIFNRALSEAEIFRIVAADSNGKCKPDEDDDDFDDDGDRDDNDRDDDNDGRDDDNDDDDDNDGENDRDDRDDDNDGIDDEFDSQSAREIKRADADVLAVGQEKAYDVSTEANTLLLIATAEAIDAMDVNQSLTLEISDPSGVVVARSPAVLGRAVATAVPALPGTYKVKVRNTGSATTMYRTLQITRTAWLLS